MLYDSKTPFRSMVDPKTGTVDRQIFADEAIYQLELERIFARAWNFMCHESQIPNPGDFFLSFIGEESVICVRDKKGGFQVFLNSCRHRGNAVCRAEQGNTRSFLCTYHGWTYDLEGKLIGVPGYKDLYHEQLDRSQWGLVSAGKVDAYKGFVFATMDPDAPELDDYLGPVGRIALNMAAARGPVKMVNGVQKNQIGCNWKLAVDNLFDFYHPAISHASATYSGYSRRQIGRNTPLGQLATDRFHRVVVGDYGHAIGGPRMTEQTWEAQKQAREDGTYAASAPDSINSALWREDPAAKAQLGIVGMDTTGHPNIFPNLWLTGGGTQLCLRLPKGAMKTELWWFSLLPDSFSETEQRERVYRSNHTFGPAGMLEQDDGENWDQSTRAMRGPIARKYPVNFAMAVGLGEVQPSPGAGEPTYIDTHINEHAQLWTYRSWADWMDADSWDALKRDHTRPPEAGETL